MAPLFSLTTELIVGSAPPERAGAASAISETGAEVGGAVGIAVLGSIGAAVYRAAVQSGLPSGIPPQAAQIARDTLGGAVSVAAQLPAGQAEPLLEVTRRGFVQGFHLVAGISVVIAVAAAAIAVAMLRRAPAGTGVEEREQTPAAQTAGE
jgi:DHA2 family multidrug resistance protein-like MFS transporter